MTEYEKRVVVVPEIIDINRLHKDQSKISIFSQVFEITRSKLTTSLWFTGRTNYTIVDSEPETEDNFFALALIPTKYIKVMFEDHEDVILVPGDLLCSSGMEYKTILAEDDSMAQEGIHFISVKYAVKEKKQHGSGPNKYKAHIVFSDKYEVEVFANNKEEAHKIALETPFYDWNHVWDIDKNRADEYRSQKTRYSMWLPEDIKVDNQ